MKKQVSLITALCLMLFSAASGAYLTLSLTQSGFAGGAQFSEDAKRNQQKFSEVQEIVDRYFVGEYDANTAMDFALEGYIYGLGDKWSHYLPAEGFDSFNQDMQEDMVGIGVSVAFDIDSDGIYITEVYEGSPAQEAGLKAGDIITKVEDVTVGRDTYYDAVDAVRGEEGSDVTLIVKRGEEAPKEWKIPRKSFPKTLVRGEMLPGSIGYVRISNFDPGSDAQFKSVVDGLAGQGAKAFVMDVRNNPGGTVDSLHQILDKLLPEGDIITLKLKGEEKGTVLKSDKAELGLPMAVLTNSQSISAAEFFAAALQEYGKAVIVGEKTGGKGYSQYPFELSDGSALVLSNNTYYTPKGKSLVPDGVTPDVETALSEEQSARFYKLPLSEDPQLKAAVEAVAK